MSVASRAREAKRHPKTMSAKEEMEIDAKAKPIKIDWKTGQLDKYYGKLEAQKLMKIETQRIAKEQKAMKKAETEMLKKIEENKKNETTIFEEEGKTTIKKRAPRKSKVVVEKKPEEEIYIAPAKPKRVRKPKVEKQ